MEPAWIHREAWSTVALPPHFLTPAAPGSAQKEKQAERTDDSF